MFPIPIINGFVRKERYVNDTLCPYVFIKWSPNGYVIITVHILNIIGTPNELKELCVYMKYEFEMRDLGKTNYVLPYRATICLKECYYNSLLI